MGYLLKEALKALCSIHQWSYAVFWKFGCQNPKLLIWEECYHGSLPNPDAPHISNMGNQGITLQKLEGYNGARVGDPVRLLIDKMMMSKQVNMVGEGLVGRAAFAGNHQWIVSGNYNENAHPAEVLNEVNLQFAAGMQTIAVIPVLPHGVVQLASPLAIMENVGYVHDVKSLILQVGCVPSTFMSENYGARNSSSLYGPPVDATSIPLDLHENQIQMNSSLVAADGFNLPKNTSQTLRHANHSSNSLLTQFQDNLHVSGSMFTMPNLMQESCKSLEDHNTAKISSVVDNKVNGGIVMPLKPDSLINQQACSNNPVSGVNCPPPSASSRSSTLLKQPIISSGGVPERNHKISSSSSSISAPHFNTNKGYHAIMEGCSTNLMSRSSELGVGINGEHSHLLQKSIHSNMGLHEADTSIKELVAMFNTGDQSCSRSILGLPIHENNNGDNGLRAKHNHDKGHDSDMHEVLKVNSKLQHMLTGDSTPGDFCCGSKVTSSKDLVSEDVLFQSSAGDDLFDVLGVDFKNKLLNGNDSKLQNRLDANAKDQIKNFPWSVNVQNLSSDYCSDYYDGISESGVCSLSGSDHLLDAVISGVSAASRQISDDNMSCRTTLSKISNSSIPSTPQRNPSLSGVVNMSDQMQGHLFWLSKPMMRLGEPVSTSIRSACGKNDSRNCSLSSSTYGSQLSSWIEQGPSVSVSTANSKKPDETGKTNRKRLKPGENPRPRPKDRQMIQDRVKELREIVPNGAKCSIDALLERTIKHMLFLQSVTKHADKLKQTVESKITNREDGRLLKDNFEGGATWAFELGSQSMVCPIVVEDLNPPRQLLIEMLCEERGFFLEIADLIRGLGLTILKGVMEARNDKIWARFAVEANRDVTRMEVFISLVHLLEQTLNGSSASANGTTDKNVKTHSTTLGANEQLVGPVGCGEPSAV